MQMRGEGSIEVGEGVDGAIIVLGDRDPLGSGELQFQVMGIGLLLLPSEDGSVLAQLGSPDMRTPIAYSLAWPERMEAPVKRLSLAEIGSLTFRAPDYEAFRCLALAKEALDAGGAAPAVLNAANEVAVGGFLSGQIGFMDIPALVEETLAQTDMKAPQSLTNVFEIDQEARRLAGLQLESRKK